MKQRTSTETEWATGLFTVIPTAQVVLHKNGVYRQVNIYRRGRYLFAKYGAGFIALRSNRHTTLPDWQWDCIDGVEWEVGAHSRLRSVKDLDNEEEA